MSHERSKRARSGPASGDERNTLPHPAGNAEFDPRQQSKRLDMPADEENGRGTPGRGSEPSRAPDRSLQPQRDRDALDERDGARSEGDRP